MKPKTKLSSLLYGAILFTMSGFPLPAAAQSMPFLASVSAFSANLSGFQEVPPIATSGSGTFSATIDVNNQTINYRLTYNGLSSTPAEAHIHFGQPGVNGGVIAFLCGGGTAPACPASGTVSGSITASDILGPVDQGITPGDFQSALSAIINNATYANVHTANFPEGEIRGLIDLNMNSLQSPPEPSGP